MAAGDVGKFNTVLSFFEDTGYDFGSLSVRVALVNNVTTPVAGLADPRFTAGGGTNFKTNEVTVGGSYAADGVSVSATFSRSSNTATGVLDFETNATWSQNASNPDTPRWAIVYVNTTNKPCIGWVDLGAVIDMTAGDLTISWNANGFITVT